jgi:fumarate reductase (CoM/CoB) subunit B
MGIPQQISVRLFRYDPSKDDAPRYQLFGVPYRRSMRVLDALNYIYDELDDCFAYRWFCGVKKCGECGITVNGKSILACWEPVGGDMTCEPLTNFPIVRDLAVDVSAYERMMLELIPYVQRKSPPRFPEILPHARMRAAHELSRCIECNVCSAEVPVGDITADGIDWSGCAGPAALVKFARFALDPRDEADRPAIALRAGLKTFRDFGRLNGVCPQGIDIAAEALVPALRKLFDEPAVEARTVDSARIFVMTGAWSAFVRMTDGQRSGLLESGRMTPRTIAGIDHAYVFDGGAKRLRNASEGVTQAS